MKMNSRETQTEHIVELLLQEISNQEKEKISEELIRNVVKFLESESLRGSSKPGLETQLNRIIEADLNND